MSEGLDLRLTFGNVNPLVAILCDGRLEFFPPCKPATFLQSLRLKSWIAMVRNKLEILCPGNISWIVIRKTHNPCFVISQFECNAGISHKNQSLKQQMKVNDKTNPCSKSKANLTLHRHSHRCQHIQIHIHAAVTRKRASSISPYSNMKEVLWHIY